ncbi:MAG: RNA polymerase sigma-I factor [Clostridia bacterium]|nr:RNA polymerase sigma-I factor [Clostridia bacterium]
MIKLNIFNRQKAEEDPLRELVCRIQSGDNLLKEKLINDYKPFILKTVARIIGKYVEVENSEEFSIGLLAFNEAVNCFDVSRHKTFLSFADLVINRRVIDYIRKNKKVNNVFPFTYFEEDEGERFEERYLSTDAVGELNNIEIKEEILIFKEKLEAFGITLGDLAKAVPKHRDSKQLCIKIAKTMIDSPELFEKLNRTKNIPMTELLKRIDVYHGTVEKNRKFIIAVSLILDSGLEVIKSYVHFVEEGGAGRD